MPGTHIVGFPYFPGTATGRLHRGTSVSGDTALCIVMLSQHEIISFKGHAAGLIIVEAAPFSHSMIGLLGFGLPTVLISTKQAEQLGAGIELVIAEMKGPVRDRLMRYGLGERFGPERFAPTVGAAVDRIIGHERTDIGAPSDRT